MEETELLLFHVAAAIVQLPVTLCAFTWIAALDAYCSRYSFESTITSPGDSCGRLFSLINARVFLNELFGS